MLVFPLVHVIEFAATAGGIPCLPCTEPGIVMLEQDGRDVGAAFQDG